MKIPKSDNQLKKYCLFWNGGLSILTDKQFSFLRMISKGIAWITIGKEIEFSILTGIIPLTNTNKPPLHSLASILKR